MRSADFTRKAGEVKAYGDSLRGYGHQTHVRCNFTCQYCAYDGRAFPNWFQLTVDHVIPTGQGGTDDEENKVTAYQAYNSITSRMTFGPGASREEVLVAKRERVKERQSEFFAFWEKNVAPLYLSRWQEAD